MGCHVSPPQQKILYETLVGVRVKGCVCPWFTGGGQLGSVGVRVKGCVCPWRRSAGFSRGQGQVRCVCPWFTAGGQLGSVGVRVRLGVFVPGSLAEVSWVQ